MTDATTQEAYTQYTSGENAADEAARKRAREGYVEAVGRRKTSVARVRISEKSSGKTEVTINGKSLEDYFPTKELRDIPVDPFTSTEYPVSFSISVIVRGGGVHAQAEAIRHGITRTLVTYDSALRKQLKQEGFLKRDPRQKERKKFGLKKARKSPQWSKR